MPSASNACRDACQMSATETQDVLEELLVAAFFTCVCVIYFGVVRLLSFKLVPPSRPTPVAPLRRYVGSKRPAKAANKARAPFCGGHPLFLWFLGCIGVAGDLLLGGTPRRHDGLRPAGNN